MTAIPLSFDRHLDTDFSRDIAAVSQWCPGPAAGLAPAVVSGDRYRATLALGPGGRRPVELRVSRWSETRGTHVELVPLHRVRATRGYLRRSRALLRDAFAAMERGPIPIGQLGPDDGELRRSA
ncbi:MAG: hypothetical protein ACRDYB_06190 [Acidimicrobiales bacterium]